MCLHCEGACCTVTFMLYFFRCFRSQLLVVLQCAPQDVHDDHVSVFLCFLRAHADHVCVLLHVVCVVFPCHCSLPVHTQHCTSKACGYITHSVATVHKTLSSPARVFAVRHSTTPSRSKTASRRKLRPVKLSKLQTSTKSPPPHSQVPTPQAGPQLAFP